ncbi:MAG: cold shock domain-containing protein [Marinomonas sp.]|jgi:CspA family cold shock protein|uniref:cold shock domain-containing protein n=1 Tax=unclassified Marinomonas TaxID=196814 RepID=UPI0007AFAC41|nr:MULTISPECIES: cold shock domain-containing protein [unclassified Marinomonas]
MYQGRVKWFNNAKGYGFIVSDSFDEDLFTHYSSIMIDGYKTLKAGQAVTFETSPGKQGMHAVDITPITDDQTDLNHIQVNGETHTELTASA